VPNDVARGRYVIGLRKDSPELQGAVNAALDHLKRTGELERILRDYKLWDSRQPDADGVRAPTPPPEASSRGGAEPPRIAERRLGSAQIMLFLQGALVTLMISAASFALASPLGITLATLRLYRGPVGRALSAAYVELFRGTPLLLQLYVLYFGLAGVVRLSPLVAAVLGLALNYGAYEAEVYRAALLAVPAAQTEAACALGMSRWQAIRHVVFPQALRTALPAVTNDFVALLKDSSLISVITVVELTKRMTIVAVELRDWVTPGLLCAALYFAMSFPLARWARRIERTLEPLGAQQANAGGSS
jgi:polar amino acid transport system substrate-binding protein